MSAGSNVDVLALRGELEELVTSLWYEIDHNGGTAAATYFARDAELRFSNAVFRGPEQIEEVYRNRSARGPRTSRHVVTNLRLLEVADESVRAISVLLLFGEDGLPPRPSTSPAMVGDVLDVFGCVNGRWLIKSRWIRNVFIEPATELAVPQE
ncbi:nuclear transport factor 2 family protein [Amycolatopsis pigmentata]|uniref:Nuclear transport factor 2 family protein n=1 Tax=Amycolatopsis pigmentata TaxID=450801 RepID=A0ABW5FNF3_9PSEU